MLLEGNVIKWHDKKKKQTANVMNVLLFWILLE